MSPLTPFVQGHAQTIMGLLLDSHIWRADDAVRFWSPYLERVDASGLGWRGGDMTSPDSVNQKSVTDTALPSTDHTRRAEAAGADGMAAGDWAVCCSGGGIRSAAYCLGALQSLEEGGLLAKVKWIPPDKRRR